MCTELYCPLCNISTFPDIDSFKFNLIKVNSKPIKCPLCAEILLGLDKLTIHLFAHSLQPEEDIKKIAPQNDSSPTTMSSKLFKKSSISTTLGGESTAAVEKKQSRIKLVKMTSSLASQNTISTKEENFRCEICGFVFVDEQLLNLHLSLVHNFTPKGNNENGIQSLSSQPSSPKGCVSETEGGLMPEGKLWNCHLCGKHFKMKGALRIHIRVAHVRFHDQNQKQINIADYLKSQKSSSLSSSSIDLCTIKTELLSLQDPYSPPDNTSQQQFYNAASSPTYASASQSPTHCLVQENALKFSKTFQCEECKKSFTTKYFLKKHKRLHTGEMPYKCDVEGCGKMFHFQQSYHKHLLYHSDAKPYECNECGRSFKELSTLHNHQRIHSGIKPFGCHVCGKFFRQKVSYLVHQRIHNGLLPYKCSECGKGFRYKVSQRSHKCSGALLERKPGDLIQKLMQNSLILPSSNNPSIPTPPSLVCTDGHIATETIALIATPSTNDVHISTSNLNNKEEQEETAQHETHDLCLDDLLKESYEKLMKVQPSQTLGDNGFGNHTILSTTFGNNGSGMALNSNYSELTAATAGMTNNTNFIVSYHPALETINEDSIKELLYGHVG